MTATRNHVPLKSQTIPMLRAAWDYGRNGRDSELALRELRRRGQVCPDGQPHAFGTVIEQHEVGDHYVIVEYRRDTPTCHRGVEVPPDGVSQFTTFVDGKRTSYSWKNFDSALVHCVAYRRMIALSDSTGSALNEAPRAVTNFMRVTDVSHEAATVA